MITANITVDVRCESSEEAKAAREKLEAAGFKVVSLLDPRTFQAKMQQVVSSEEV